MGHLIAPPQPPSCWAQCSAPVELGVAWGMQGHGRGHDVHGGSCVLQQACCITALKRQALACAHAECACNAAKAAASLCALGMPPVARMAYGKGNGGGVNACALSISHCPLHQDSNAYLRHSPPLPAGHGSPPLLLQTWPPRPLCCQSVRRRLLTQGKKMTCVWAKWGVGRGCHAMLAVPLACLSPAVFVPRPRCLHCCSASCA